MGSQQTQYPKKVGWWVGAAVACQRRGECAGIHPDAQPDCDLAVKRLEQHPEECPDKIYKNMHQDSTRRPRPKGSQTGN